VLGVVIIGMGDKIWDKSSSSSSSLIGSWVAVWKVSSKSSCSSGDGGVSDEGESGVNGDDDGDERLGLGVCTV
jgi:hypothetical protein